MVLPVSLAPTVRLISASSLQDGSTHDAFDTSLKFEENDVDNVSVLTVSVQGKQYSITPHEVSQMPLQSFSALWTVSFRPWQTLLPHSCKALRIASGLFSVTTPYHTIADYQHSNQPDSHCICPMFPYGAHCHPFTKALTDTQS